jgi:hypothetical protein
MRHHAAVLALLAALAPIASAQTPRPSPDLTINLSGGATLDLKQLRGKLVALAFIGIT